MASFFQHANNSPCSFRGPPGFQQALFMPECYQPPFLISDGMTGVCNTNYASVGSCLSDTECQISKTGNVCSSGTCLQQISNEPSQLFNSQGNRHIGQFKSGNARINRWVDNQEKRQLESTGNVALQDMFLATDADGEQFYGAPLSTSQPAREQCNTCLRTIWQCNRFVDTGEIDKYNQCKQMEQCIKYNVQQPNGRLIPTSVVATPTCLGVVKGALNVCAVQCGSPVIDSRPAQADLGLFTRYVK